ncbi:hypothetical protein [Nitratireductor sp. StC3]|uniref:hypothetical protein n=1 Tax=Nitratireductor sp. StC3 TaxID=2126741 RepID=UPI0011B2195A|nr:hypothetical protein [Nitratireductor sp. StC3]
MTFDIPHMIATGAIVFLVIWITDHTSACDGMSKGRKTLVKTVAIFVLVVMLNIFWPYGSGV